MKNTINKMQWLIIFVFIGIIALSSCKEEDLPPVIQKSTLSFTVNGQSYTNQVLSFESNILGAMQMTADTIINGDTLGGVIAFFPNNTIASPKASIALSINGAAPGTFNWPHQSQLVLSFAYPGDSTKYISATDTTFTSKTIVTTYGNVGQRVSGSFSGLCISADTTLRTINISNGQFDLVRKK